MKKLKIALLSLVAITALVGCGGNSTSELTTEEKQTLVNRVIDNPVIITLNNLPIQAEEDEFTDLFADNSDKLLITTRMLVDGTRVTLEWSPSSLSAFDFISIDDSHMEAEPTYPDIEQPALGWGLSVRAKLDDVTSATKTYLFAAHAPTKVASKTSLLDAQYAEIDSLLWVEGRVTRILPDFNAAYIQDENGVGFSLYKVNEINGGQVTLANGTRRPLQVGDYVKVEGEKAGYNGLNQISWISVLEEATEPAGFPEELEPHVLNEAFFAASEPVLPGFEEAGYDGQSSLVRVEGLELVGYQDVDGKELTKEAVLAIPGKGTHFSAVTKLGETKLLLYFNYHIGKTAQQGFVDFLTGLKVGEKFNFEGVLGIYTTLQLLPVEAGDLYK